VKNWLGSHRLNSNEELVEGVKQGWVQRLQTSLVQAYKNLFPDMTRASVAAVTVLRINLSTYALFMYKKGFSLLVLLAAHRRWELQDNNSSVVTLTVTSEVRGTSMLVLLRRCKDEEFSSTIMTIKCKFIRSNYLNRAEPSLRSRQ
jgi:hypothetical protein